MKFSTETFITSVVGISVAIVVFAMVAIPVINSAATAEGVDEDLANIIGVIPIFVAIGILMACVYMFISKKA